MRRSRLSVKAAVTPAEVVVGVMQAPRILLEIDAEHHRAAVAQQSAGATQERRGLDRHEIADRRAGKEADAPARRAHDRPAARERHVVGADRFDLHAG